ncbi:hypothetical protein ABIA30_004033 [Mycobacterium sp. MAA66]
MNAVADELSDRGDSGTLRQFLQSVESSALARITLRIQLLCSETDSNA